MKTIFYPRFPLDYARDTSRLRLVHHGAYAKLLDDYYINGPLPPTLDALCAISGAVDEDERAAIKYVADTFFPINGDGLRHNKRADIEREKMEARHIEAVRKAGLAVQARRRQGASR